jgi:hypothetical protein
MVAEKVVLFAARAVRALQAADQKHSNTHRHKDGKDVRVDQEPVHKIIHTYYLIRNNHPKGVLFRTLHRVGPLV